MEYLEEVYNVFIREKNFFKQNKYYYIYLFLILSFCTYDLLIQNKLVFFRLKNKGNDHLFDETLYVLSKILSHASFFRKDDWKMVKLQGKN